MLILGLNVYRHGNFYSSDRVLYGIRTYQQVKGKYEERRNGRQEQQEFADRQNRLEELKKRAEQRLSLFGDDDE